jgi:hypothetical protein
LLFIFAKVDANEIQFDALEKAVPADQQQQSLSNLLRLQKHLACQSRSFADQGVVT